MSGSSNARHRREATGLALVLALALILLFAQFLAQTHTRVHGMVHVHVEEPDHLNGQAHEPTQGDPSLLSQLFSGHEDSTVECQAFDQLSHIDAMPGVAVLVLPLVIQPFILAISSGLATARWHALFQARGPPSLR